MTARVLGLAALAGALASSACSSVKCADGTFKSGNSCLPYDPNDKTTPTTTASPPGGRSRAAIPDFVTLTSNKPATIYYTTDGSDPDPKTSASQPSPAIVAPITQGMTLKFFAIDAAGHEEQIESTTYVQDTTPPAPIKNLAVSVTNGTATVTWTNPSDPDFAGTIVARVTDLLDAEPAPGTAYTGPAMLTQSVQIIHIGAGTQVVDPGLPNGQIRYAAWSYDDLDNYSLPTTATSDVGLLGVDATFTFTTANQTLTTVVAPTDLSITGTTASLAGTTVTLNLSVKNLTTKYFPNPKMLVTSVTGATFANADGTSGTFPFKSLGPSFFAPNATVTKTLTFTGAAANSTVTITLVLGHDPSLLGFPRPGCCTTQQHQFVDTGSGIGFTNIGALTLGRNGRGGSARPGAVIAGHLLDVPTSHGTIERWDLATFTNSGGAFIAQGTNGQNVESLLAFGGREIAILKSGGRRRGGAVHVVRLDEGLHITGRLDLPLTQGQGDAIGAISPDGTLVAVPCDGGAALVDTIQMVQVDADPTTPALDFVAPTGFVDRTRAITFLANGSGFVMIDRAGDVAIVKLAPGAPYTAQVVPPPAATKGNAVATAPDGRVWIATDAATTVFDPSTGAIGPSGYPNGGARSLAVVAGQLWVLRQDQTHVDLVVPATGAVTRTITMPAAVAGQWLQGTQ